MENFFGKIKTNTNHESSEHWMSVSDLMSGLMMVFLFISVALMRHVLIEKDRFQEIATTSSIERDKIKKVAITYHNNQIALYEAIHNEFKKDLEKWDAKIDKETLSFEFKSPDVLFGFGSSAMKPQFKDVLIDFFPRYMKVLNIFKNSISEVRIEGHTSSHWVLGMNPEDSYFKNMELSQARTRSVLLFIQGLPTTNQDRDWIRKNIAAVGLSSSHLILDQNGKEDIEKSRRVTFRVTSNADIQIRKIIKD